MILTLLYYVLDRPGVQFPNVLARFLTSDVPNAKKIFRGVTTSSRRIYESIGKLGRRFNTLHFGSTPKGYET